MSRVMQGSSGPLQRSLVCERRMSVRALTQGMARAGNTCRRPPQAHRVHRQLRRRAAHLPGGPGPLTLILCQRRHVLRAACERQLR